MVTNAEALKRLTKITIEWGGSIEIVDKHKFWEIVAYGKYNGIRGDWTHSPDDSHAINWGTKKIISIENRYDPGTIIHEMGHVFADKIHPDEGCDEWSWLGWEVCMAFKVDCYAQWTKSNLEYIVNSPPSSKKQYSWCDLSAKKKAKVIRDRIRHAKRIGIVGLSNDPIAVR